MGSFSDRKNKFEMMYEGVMLILAFVAVATIWYETKYNHFIVWGTWSIFFVDFVIRMTIAKNKWEFVKKNPFIIIAIIPLDAVFQLARMARLLHFLRLKTMTKYYAKPIMKVLESQRASKIFPFAFVVIFLSTIPLYLFEPNMTTYADAFIGGFASLVYFGYSKVKPQTTQGVVIVTMLTVLGLVIQGVFVKYIITIIQEHENVKMLRDKRKNRRNYPL